MTQRIIIFMHSLLTDEIISFDRYFLLSCSYERTGALVVLVMREGVLFCDHLVNIKQQTRKPHLTETIEFKLTVVLVSNLYSL